MWHICRSVGVVERGVRRSRSVDMAKVLFSSSRNVARVCCVPSGSPATPAVLKVDDLFDLECLCAERSGPGALALFGSHQVIS